MSNLIHDFALVILAAGEGKRMQSNLPKVMHLLQGKPLIEHLVLAGEKVQGVKKIIAVVSPKHTLVQDHFGSKIEYAVQQEQSGTGNATLVTKELVLHKVENVIVLYGDIPGITTESLQRLVDEHGKQKSVVTLITTVVSDFEEWRKPFESFGRILRNEKGEIQEIKEYKDCSEQEKNTKELNSGQYCFQTEWLFEHLPLLKQNNAQKEYYLTDIIKMALEKQKKVSSVQVDPIEALGVSTQEDLQILSTLKK